MGFVRLACLIHAANVRSEPGSNPSKVSACGTEVPSSRRPDTPSREVRSPGEKSSGSKNLRSPLRHDSKNSQNSGLRRCRKDVSASKASTPSLWLHFLPTCQRAHRLPRLPGFTDRSLRGTKGSISRIGRLSRRGRKKKWKSTPSPPRGCARGSQPLTGFLPVALAVEAFGA
jgi:hypothetical protein